MVQLRGMTWNHTRGLAPLIAAAKEYQRIHTDVAISWDVRSLKEFGDQPIEEFCARYDLVMIDHPFVGTGIEQGLIVPLDEWIPAEYIADQRRNSVGPSHRSYEMDGRQWALAADAASQVAAHRPDVMSQLGLTVPASWSDVFELAAALPSDRKIGLPLVPVDAICAFYSICANVAGTDFWDGSLPIDTAVANEALALMERLAAVAHPRSFDLNPPQMLDFMSESEEVLYVPLLFGYSNYSRTGYKPKLIHFANMPSHGPQPMGSLLGGVGISVTAASRHKQEAVRYAMFVASGESQRGLYVQSGGQPGHRSAWIDPDVNELTHGFFRRTLRTLDNAYLRPRHPGYNRFQERAGELIHHCLREGGDRQEAVRALNRLWQTLREVGPR